ncbi:hypothetical protein RUM43_010858 [Polyplax serrata]|uniref:Uncharacterized protein n=1 Tax=Polyplax serrata TaxID=468196 RepID=A0AAN8S7K1_POLSC
MSAEPDSSNPRDHHHQGGIETTANKIISDLCISISNAKISDDASKSQDENYFTKNFDECMKRIQMLEKAHEMVEKEESEVSLLTHEQNSEKLQGDCLGRVACPDEVDKSDFATYQTLSQELEPIERQEIKFHFEKQSKESEKERESENEENNCTTQHGSLDLKDEKIEKVIDENQEIISKWYSNLKQQFEKYDKNEQEKTKEISCRIMGATLKDPNEVSKVQGDERGTRHYFSNLIKSNKSLVDEELPDPDLVRKIRAKFQENLNSTVGKQLKGQFSGSLQNINSGKVMQNIWRPLSAQCNRDDIVQGTYSKTKMGECAAEFLKDSGEANQMAHIRHLRKQEKLLKTTKDSRVSHLYSNRWTDSGSVSSGVGSDFSSYEADLESDGKETLDPEHEDTITWDDYLVDDVNDKHYVQNEILEKIRSFGTSVTYYGGEMITCSVGSLLSPTAQAIMEEINEKYGYQTNVSNSFAEFYRKYAKVNEPSMRKKVGRTRSFGQNSSFQKPNVLNNREIESYKYDLEMEIGIRKPKGLTQNNIKCNSDKSNGTERCKRKHSSVSHRKPIPESNLNTAIDTIEEDYTSESQTIEVVGEGEEKSRNTKVHQSLETNEGLDVESLGKRNPLERSQSTPHEILDGTLHDKDMNQPVRLISREHLFGFDKCLINGKRIPDIQFEEYEVCDGPVGKFQTSEEEEASSCRNSEFSTLPSSEHEESNSPRISGNNEVNNNVNTDESITISGVNETKSTDTTQIPTANSDGWYSEYSTKKNAQNDSFQNEKENSKTNKFKIKNIKWPLETRGVVDLERDSKTQSPLVKSVNEKPIYKRKIRLF